MCSYFSLNILSSTKVNKQSIHHLCSLKDIQLTATFSPTLSCVGCLVVYAEVTSESIMWSTVAAAFLSSGSKGAVFLRSVV